MKLWNRLGAWMKHGLAIIFVFHLVCLSWLFFRVQGFDAAKIYLERLLRFETSGSNTLDVRDVALGIIAIVFLVLVIDLPQYISKNHTAILRWHWVWKTLVTTVLLLGLILTKRTNDAAFIYFQF